MRPLHLTLQSFGPFAGQQTVDFTCYGDNAFLLIHGVTGAGKTTILDGICYALYGDASGEKRDERYLRSQLAKQDSICEVRFLFQVGPRRFQIVRQPPQKAIVKGKQRDITHSVEFCQVDESGQIIGDRLTKIGEVQKKIEEVIGFNSDQFRQVVVLPQGEFRKLLLAKSDEKELILEKLFGTERYKLVEESLKRRRATIGSELKELKAAVDGILSTNGVGTRLELEERIADIKEQRAGMVSAIAEQGRLQKEVQERLMAAQSLAERFTEMEQARAACITLEQQKPAMELDAARAEQARKALGLSDLEEAISRGERDLLTQNDQLNKLDGLLAELETTRKSALAKSEKARADNDTLPAMISEQTALQARLEKISELSSCKTALAEAIKVGKKARAVLDDVKKEIADNETQLATLTCRIETLSLTTGTVGQLKAELEKVSALRANRTLLDQESTELAQLLVKLAAAESALKENEKKQKAAEEEHAGLQQSFINGQSALLARELADGQPCPVCGSSAHPHPAASSDRIPTEKELETARKLAADSQKSVQAATKSVGDLVSRKSGLEAGITKLKSALGTDAGTVLAELTIRHKELEAKHDAAETGAGELTIAREGRERINIMLSAAKNNLPSAEAGLAAATAEWEKQKALEARLASEAGDNDADAVKSRIVVIERFMETARKALQQADTELKAVDERLATSKGQKEEKLSAIPRLETELGKLRSDFGKRLKVEGFADDKEYRAARLTLEEIERLKKDVDAFRETLAAATARLNRADSSCSGLEKPDIAAVTTVRDVADRFLGELRSADGVLDGQQRGYDEAFKAISEKGDRIGVLEKEYAVTGKLADLTGGNNSKRMTLQRYVLAALFEEVAIAASQRLSRMSRGRYHLVRSETPRDGKATSGLDLDVTDDYIGEKRPAFTLSGGESFLASLSLALGLSDVVMAQCGGRYLDCIFIDEGFGSLDGETLDFALNTLIELHRSGRVIGIISHVAELKERIQSQIEVVGSKDGSRIVQQIA